LGSVMGGGGASENLPVGEENAGGKTSQQTAGQERKKEKRIGPNREPVLSKFLNAKKQTEERWSDKGVKRFCTPWGDHNPGRRRG